MKFSYLQSMNQIVSDQINQMENTLVFGENIDRGSFISGLSKNLKADTSRILKNVGNCEYTHCGVGFGLMMSGHNAVLYVKQLDFMMLGIDHFVSTYGLIRATKWEKPLGSFTIVTAIYDQGFQGPQSSFRGLSEICSMSGVNGFLLQELSDARKIVKEEISRPGIRFLALSQRKAGEELFECDVFDAALDNSVIQYERGSDVSIVCFGHSLSHGRTLVGLCRERGITVNLFSVNYVLDGRWELAFNEISRTRKLIIIDDTRSATSFAFRFLTDVLEFDSEIIFTVVRNREKPSTVVSDESFEVEYGKLVRWIND